MPKYKTPCFETLDFSKKIFVLVSGGRDSTAMTLALADYVYQYQSDYEINLLFGDTHLNRKVGRDTVARLAEETDFPLIVAKYQGENRVIDVLRGSFEMIPKAIERHKFHNTGAKSYKTLFPCCDLLKKRPMKDFLKTLEKDSTIQLLGIKAGDNAIHRRYRLRQLRDADTFYRKQRNGFLYYYPLRDCQEADIEKVLQEFGFQDTQSSGCSVCPIFCVADWDSKDPETARRSKLMAQRFGIELRAENQMPLSAFCSEIE
jgi:3'-phosphoadenosine 5'-phosphosulfate sulfotransferase (PAPS reductase)/FAD synthetase